MSDKFNLKDNVETKEEAKFMLDADKWKHRRNFAYKSFYMIIAITAAVLFAAASGVGIANFATIENYLITTVVGLISIIGMYYGVTGWYDVSKKKKEEDTND